METGWIKISRKILEWGWWDEPATFQIFVYLIIKANHDDVTWHGVTIHCGELVTSLRHISSETPYTEKQIRLVLQKLQKTGEIIVKTSNKYSHITICNYAKYQLNEDVTGQTKGKQEANKWQAEVKQKENGGQTKGNKQEYKEGEEGEEYKERDTNVSPKKVAITPYQAILDLYHGICTSLPKVISLNDTRRKHITARWNEWGKDDEQRFEKARAVFTEIEKSDFLTGRTNSERKWTCTFDWIFQNDGNWVKILEGVYRNKDDKQQVKPQNVKLGKCEYIDKDGNRRYCEAGPIVPLDAPPRRSTCEIWSTAENAWVVEC